MKFLVKSDEDRGHKDEVGSGASTVCLRGHLQAGYLVSDLDKEILLAVKISVRDDRAPPDPWSLPEAVAR